SALQTMHSYDRTSGQYRDCQQSNPTIVRSFGTNFSVEEETEFVTNGIAPNPFQSASRSWAIARHGAVAVDRRALRKAEQFVHFFGPGQPVRVCNVAMPVAKLRDVLV